MNLDDRRHLRAAEGWLGLRDWRSANEELDEITPTFRAHPQVLLLRCEIYRSAGRLDMALEVARGLAQHCPNNWRVHFALARYHAQAGHFVDTRASLERAFALSRHDLRSQALDDKDLEPFWQNIGRV